MPCVLIFFQVERYDPPSNKWTMMAPLRDGVSNAAVVSAKLKLFVFGGTTIHRDKASKVGGEITVCYSVLLKSV